MQGERLELEQFLSKFGYTSEQISDIINNNSILICSNDTIREYNKKYPQKALISNVMVSFKKYLQNENINAELIYEQNKSNEYLELKSADILLPDLIILIKNNFDVISNLIMGFVSGLFANFIYDRINRKNNLTIKSRIIYDGRIYEYEGPISGFNNFLKSINDNE